MLEQEFNPELIREIEEFLRQEREAKQEVREETATLADVREDLRGQVLEQMVQGLKLSDYLNQLRDVSMNVVAAERAVIEDDELTVLAQDASQLVILTKSSDEDEAGISVHRYPTSVFGAFTLVLSEETIPSFFPARHVIFENYLSGNIEDVNPQLAQALGINGERPTGKLTIERGVGAMSDPQTKSAMEHAVREFPQAPFLGLTDYYFFGNRIGKVVTLPPSLLGERAIGDGYSHKALSEMTRGDLAIIKVGLHAVEQALMPHISIY